VLRARHALEIVSNTARSKPSTATMDPSHLVPVSARRLQRRAVFATLRTLLTALSTLLLSGWVVALARDHLDISSITLMFAAPLLTTFVIAFVALKSWNQAWVALEPADGEAHRWAVAQAAHDHLVRAYLARLYLMRRRMLQEDVWCLEAIISRRTSQQPTRATAEATVRAPAAPTALASRALGRQQSG